MHCHNPLGRLVGRHVRGPPVSIALMCTGILSGSMSATIARLLDQSQTARRQTACTSSTGVRMNARLKFWIAIGVCGTICGCAPGADKSVRGQKETPPSGDVAMPSSTPVSLSGCLEAGPVGAATYVLRNVRFEPATASDPHRNSTTSRLGGITEGAWVTVASTENLQPQIGRRVAVSGIVTDDGENTIGTAGSSGTVLPSGERSQAASTEHHSTKVKKESGRIARESMANGMAAEIRAQQVTDLGEPCRDAGDR